MFILLLLATFGCISVQARIWRTNNNPGVAADATTLQAAHDSASNGDTVHLEASVQNYGNLSCSKRLVIIGPGYYLTANPETQANPNSSKIENIYFNTGSDGSIVTGCEILYSVQINVSNILIMRNKMRNMYISGTVIGNLIIKQNIIMFDGYWDGSFININSSTLVSNLILRNNFIQQYSGNYAICGWNANVSGIFENNVVKNSYTTNGIAFQNFIVKNNIFIDASFSGVNCTVYNNIGSGTQFGNTNGNQQNVDMATVFAGPSGNSSDGQWQLASGSPALGAGEGGTDCGMFGGADPYVLSGLPGVPAIYYFNTQGTGSQQFIRVKVKSHN